MFGFKVWLFVDLTTVKVIYKIILQIVSLSSLYPFSSYFPCNWIKLIPTFIITPFSGLSVSAPTPITSVQTGSPLDSEDRFSPDCVLVSKTFLLISYKPLFDLIALASSTSLTSVISHAPISFQRVHTLLLYPLKLRSILM